MKNEIALLVVVSFSQVIACKSFPTLEDPCQGIQSATDAFGSTQKGYTSYFDRSFRAVGLWLENGQPAAKFMFASGSMTIGTIKEGSELTIAFADGEVFRSVTSNTAPPIMGANASSVFTQWVVEVKVDPSLVAKMTDSPISAVRIAEEALLTLGVPEKNAARLQHAARCLQKDAPFNGDDDLGNGGTEI